MLRCSAASTWICCWTWVHGVALLVGVALAGAQGVFQVGQAPRPVLDLGGQQFGFSSASSAGTGQAFELGMASRGGPAMGNLLGQLDQALLHALAPFHHVADLGFQAPDIGRGLIQPALGLVHLVARSVVGLADGFQLGLDAAQVGHAPSRSVHGLQAVHARTFSWSASASARSKPLLVLLERPHLPAG